jgi:hypothetical protein
MNAHAGDLVKAREKAKSLRGWLCMGAAAVLGGCASNPLADAPVDPTSPVAAEVAAIANTNRPFPRFSDIPKTPEDERPVATWASAAGEVQGASQQLARETGPDTWTLQNTETFAARARADVRDEPASERAGGDTETFAREQRERATPPPPAR